jgi:hypothetical protein
MKNLEWSISDSTGLTLLARNEDFDKKSIQYIYRKLSKLGRLVYDEFKNPKTKNPQIKKSAIKLREFSKKHLPRYSSK